ncbi:MAG: glycosyltransferase [Pseudomonadota bacterium]
MKTKKGQPIVSVVIPTFNRGWILKEAIDSVLSQNFDDFELIIIDDGSTDNTRDLLACYGDRLFVIHQPNKGVSAARNRGISAASGRYIAFLDSDDLWLPNKLLQQLTFFSSNPNALICQTEEIWIRNGIRVNPKKKHRKCSGMIFEQSLPLCLVSPSAVMMERSLFRIIGDFDEDLYACEDYDLWLRVSCRYPIHLIDEPLVIKRSGHRDQLSKSRGLDRFRIRSLLKILRSDLLSKTQADAARKTLYEKCIIFAGGCSKRGRFDDYRQYMNLADQYKDLPEKGSVMSSA